MPRGDHLSIWFAKEDRWLFTAIDKLQEGFRERGIPMSKSQLVVAILKAGIERYAEESENHLS